MPRCEHVLEPFNISTFVNRNSNYCSFFHRLPLDSFLKCVCVCAICQSLFICLFCPHSDHVSFSGIKWLATSMSLCMDLLISLQVENFQNCIFCSHISMYFVVVVVRWLTVYSAFIIRKKEEKKKNNKKSRLLWIDILYVHSQKVGVQQHVLFGYSF